MNFELYRITRDINFEEWIIERTGIPSEERFLIIFELDYIRAYLITPDKNAADNEKFLTEIEGLYHFHQNFREGHIEVINVDLLDSSGNTKEGMDATDVIDEVAAKYRKIDNK